MHVVGVIPARMGSSRFPGKPLALIAGLPMIGHVYFRSAMSARLEAVYLATCDEEIAEYAASIGAPVIMTSAAHERASDRTAEAVTHIEAKTGRPVDVAVMIQGDEPMVLPSMIDAAVDGLLADDRAPVVNLLGHLRSADEMRDPNEIKVVVDRESFALYFSRAPIPYVRDGKGRVSGMKQVCIIPFRRDFLRTFTELTPTPLEIAESVDMMRVLEHGYRVKMVEAGAETISVDTPEDLANVEIAMRGDALIATYGRGR
jgi:3-deoxy-manno-octulosonate cytidylyltransferase (CMP-KDO synthetase)